MNNTSNLGITAVVLTGILILSLGLCGFANTPMAGHEPYGLLLLSGAGLFVSIVGLFVAGIAALVRNNKAPK